MSRPVVVIPCCTKTIGGLPFDAVGRKYTAAVSEVADCQPLLAPVGTGLSDIARLLEIADGILLSGSLSNVFPSEYGSDEAPVKPDFVDRERDAITLPLIRAALEKNKPLFAICRGFQELNVALGGTLHQAVHDVTGKMDHREPNADDMDVKFDLAHPITLQGRLKDWIGRDNIMVNSLHGQGIKTLAPRLEAQAHAADGIVEAVLGPSEHPFLLGVQWHPEWKAASNPVSVNLFRRFGDATRVKAS